MSEDRRRRNQPGHPPPSVGYDVAAVARALARLDGTPLAAFFQQAPATLWMTDTDLTLTFVCGPLLGELHVDPSQLVGHTLPDLLMDGRGDHPMIQRHRLALEGHDATLRIDWGGKRYDARIAPLRDEAGEVTGCVGVYHCAGGTDADGLLRESDIRLSRIVDSNMIGIAFGNADGQITDANEAFLTLAGFTREDLVADGISWPTLIPVEAHQRQMQALEEIAVRGRCDPFEVTLLRRDGRRIPVMVGGARLSVTRREGVAFVLDMSEHRTQVGLLETELAMADVLADAASLEEAAPGLVRGFAEALGWRAIGLWTAGPDGRLTMAASHNLTPDLVPRVASMAGRIRRADVTRASAAAQTVAAPLRAGGECYGALVLMGRADGLWDPALIAVCDRTAGRIAKLLARTHI